MGWDSPQALYRRCGIHYEHGITNMREWESMTHSSTKPPIPHFTLHICPRADSARSWKKKKKTPPPDTLANKGRRLWKEPQVQVTKSWDRDSEGAVLCDCKQVHLTSSPEFREKKAPRPSIHTEKSSGAKIREGIIRSYLPQLLELILRRHRLKIRKKWQTKCMAATYIDIEVTLYGSFNLRPGMICVATYFNMLAAGGIIYNMGTVLCCHRLPVLYYTIDSDSILILTNTRYNTNPSEAKTKSKTLL